MSIVLDWQKKLGYKNDPFVNNPTHNIFGLKEVQERINLFLLREEKLAVIKAQKGCGKASFLLWLEKELQGFRKLIIIDLKEINSQEKLEEFLLKKATPKIRFLFKRDKGFDALKKYLQKKEVILAFKEPQLITSAQKKLFDDLLKNTKVRIIVLGEEGQLKKDFLDTKPQANIAFPQYDNKTMKQILQHRIEQAGGVKTFPFDEKTIDELVKSSKNIPQKFLELARNTAIELSLKDLTPPEKKEKKPTSLPEKKEPKQEEELTSALQEEEKRGFSLFGKVRFELNEEDTDNNYNKTKKEEKHKEDDSKDVSLDAEELRKIVEGK